MGSLRLAYCVAAIGGLLVGGLVAIAIYDRVLDALTQDAREELELEIAQRAPSELTTFDQLVNVELRTVELFFRYFDTLPEETVNEVFESAFLEFGDGTRRSPPSYFDGHVSEDGTLTYGIGAFAGLRAGLDADQKRILTAAFLTVRQAGPALAGELDNLYFTDANDNLIMFGPDREDRLLFYRERAPADFSFQSLPIVEVVKPANNPMGSTACTGLDRIISQTDGTALTIGCLTPLRAAGRHLGSIGTTLDTTDYLYTAVTEPGAAIITRSGELIAHRDLLQDSAIDRSRADEVARRIEPEIMARTINGQGRPSGVVEHPGRNGQIGYIRLSAPGWYIVNYREYGPVKLQAAGFALAIAMIILIAFLSQARLIARYLPFGPNARLNEH
ncbi:hypothetical protein [Marinicauda sp. Alg238-R41]|uniref:hypothetical protein n=1 Tax=Marinicauda sp. Alg238-R41 TaxID=2993447 RepID=UPI0022DEFF5C|nr:hypothetical protein [Marinicauda sp. Alg238-R41]